MFHTKFIELLCIRKCQFFIAFCFFVTVALNFEKSRAYVNFRCFYARNGKNKLDRIMSKKLAVVFCGI